MIKMEGAPLPTAETTLFNDRTAVALEAMGRVLRASDARLRAKAFKELVRVGNDPSKRVDLYGIVDGLSRDAFLKSSDPSRAEAYDEIRKGLSSEYIFIWPPIDSDQGSLVTKLQVSQGKKIAILERTNVGTILDGTVQMVNDFTNAALPNELGVIPTLRIQDIHGATEKSFREMMRMDLQDPEMFHRMLEAYRSNGYDPGIVAPDHINFATETLAAGAPLICHSGFLNMLERSRRIASKEYASFSVAGTFTHENFHRAHSSQVNNISLGDALALAKLDQTIAEANFKATKNKQLRDDLAAVYGSVPQRAVDKGAFTIVTGAWVTVAYIDDDGKYRVLAQGGYDMNEAIVEYLIKPIRAEIIKYFDRNLRHFDTRNGDIRRSFTELSDSSHRINDYSSQVDNYLSSLGLKTREQRMKAFMGGQIPLLHLKTFGSKRPYFT